MPVPDHLRPVGAVERLQSRETMTNQPEPCDSEDSLRADHKKFYGIPGEICDFPNIHVDYEEEFPKPQGDPNCPIDGTFRDVGLGGF